jgi:hypothetical protein
VIGKGDRLHFFASFVDFLSNFLFLPGFSSTEYFDFSLQIKLHFFFASFAASRLKILFTAKDAKKKKRNFIFCNCSKYNQIKNGLNLLVSSL